MAFTSFLATGGFALLITTMTITSVMSIVMVVAIITMLATLMGWRLDFARYKLDKVTKRRINTFAKGEFVPAFV